MGRIWAVPALKEQQHTPESRLLNMSTEGEGWWLLDSTLKRVSENHGSKRLQVCTAAGAQSYLNVGLWEKNLVV
jgi:hypothetical protein